MEKKIYVNVIVESEKLCNTYDVFDTFEKAKKNIYDCVKEFADCRRVKETEFKNRFEITDENGNHRHTIEIRDLWVR